MSNRDRKNGTSTDDRKDDGTFARGNSGRPKGARNRTTLAVEALLEGQAEALTQAAIEKALEGDTVALRLCLDRIAPASKDKPISFEMPEIKTAADAANVSRAILKAVADGEVTPAEAAGLSGLIETFRRTIETTELDERISKLEGTA